MSSLTTFILPNFHSQCPYHPRVNPLTEVTALNTEKWVLRTLDYDDRTRARFLKTKGGILAGYCYPNAKPFQFQVVSIELGKCALVVSRSSRSAVRPSHPGVQTSTTKFSVTFRA